MPVRRNGDVSEEEGGGRIGVSRPWIRSRPRFVRSSRASVWPLPGAAWLGARYCWRRCGQRVIELGELFAPFPFGGQVHDDLP